MSQSNASFSESPIAHAFLWPFKWLISIAFMLALSSLLTIGVHVWNARQQIELRPQALEQAVFDRTAEAISGAGPWGLNTQLAQRISDGLYHCFFRWTSIHDEMTKIDGPQPLNKADSAYRNLVIVPYQKDIVIAMIAIQIYGLRLMILVSALPILLLVYWAGFLDGLVERSIRKLGAARESASLYHRAKYMQLMGFGMLFLGFLSWPSFIDPAWVFLPTAAALAYLVRLQWKYYKKYL